MDTVLCHQCQTVNPAFARFCASCNIDLLDETQNVPPPPPEPVSADKLRRNALIAVVLSVLTTVGKVWLLYVMKESAHMRFPQARDLMAILLPITGAGLAAILGRSRWYWILIIDSAAMILVLLLVAVALVGSSIAR